ncbi:hypothetical protein D3C87_1852680 [compost metagenome]
MLNNRFQAADAAIMHIRCRKGNIAQGRYFESGTVTFEMGKTHTATVAVLLIQTIILKTIVSKIKITMTAGAIGPFREK